MLRFLIGRLTFTIFLLFFLTGVIFIISEITPISITPHPSPLPEEIWAGQDRLYGF